MKEANRCRYYFRYCDDIVVLHSQKQRLHDLRRQTQSYFEHKLNVQLKENWQVFPVDRRGIDFLGYRFYHTHVLLRKSIATRFKRSVARIRRDWREMKPSSIASSLMSYVGWMQHADCRQMQRRHIDAKIDDILAGALSRMRQERHDAVCAN
jgi:hypothetical protein